MRDLVDRPERRAALGQAALERAPRLHVGLHGAGHARRSWTARWRPSGPGCATRFARSDSGKAAGLAAATLGNNAIQLAFTVVFTRLLGQTDYGTLAALISAFLILLVAGQSVQLAAAREAALDRLGHPEVLRATLRAWTRQLLVALVAVDGGLGAPARAARRAASGCSDVPWAAAAIPPTGVLWMLLSLQRGALQGLRAYRPVGVSIVGEAAGRLVCGLILVGRRPGRDRRAAWARRSPSCSSPLWLERELVRVVGPVRRVSEPLRTLRSLVGDGWVPIIGLFLLASLQNVDVILAKHQLGGDAAGSYAAAAVAAKAVVWVAIGVGLHLLPEATRRAAAGLDPRPVLLRALGDPRGRRRAGPVHLRGGARVAVAPGLRAGSHRGLRRAAGPRRRDDAAGLHLPDRAVHGRAGRNELPVGARRRGPRRAVRPDRGSRGDRRLRDDRVRRAVRGRVVGPGARAHGPPRRRRAAAAS